MTTSFVFAPVSFLSCFVLFYSPNSLVFTRPGETRECNRQKKEASNQWSGSRQRKAPMGKGATTACRGKEEPPPGKGTEAPL